MLLSISTIEVLSSFNMTQIFELFVLLIYIAFEFYKLKKEKNVKK